MRNFTKSRLRRVFENLKFLVQAKSYKEAIVEFYLSLLGEKKVELQIFSSYNS